MKPPCGVFFGAPGTLELKATEALPMSRSRNEPERAPRRRRRRHHHGSAPAAPPAPAAPSAPVLPEEPEAEEVDLSLLSSEERAYVEAKRRAEEKVHFYREAVKLGLVVVPLLIFLPVLGAIVLFFGGVKLGRRFYRTVIEPGLRERLIREEVSKRVEFKVTRERESLEGRHARSLEELSASIAHEIRNPITAAKSLVQQMGEDPGASDNVEYANVALGELERQQAALAVAEDADAGGVDALLLCERFEGEADVPDDLVPGQELAERLGPLAAHLAPVHLGRALVETQRGDAGVRQVPGEVLEEVGARLGRLVAVAVRGAGVRQEQECGGAPLRELRREDERRAQLDAARAGQRELAGGGERGLVRGVAGVVPVLRIRGPPPAHVRCRGQGLRARRRGRGRGRGRGCAAGAEEENREEHRRGRVHGGGRGGRVEQGAL